MLIASHIGYAIHTIGRYGRLRLVSFESDEDELFRRVTLDALKWIEQHDARRFQRVQKHLRGIVYERLVDYASYDSRRRECDVNFSRFAPDWRKLEPNHYEWYLTRYASTIVHEATHGYLRSLGFATTPKNREQVERICHTEQIRFIRRVRSEYYDYAADMVWPFDASLWHEHWNMTRWQYARKLWRKIWERDNESPASTGYTQG